MWSQTIYPSPGLSAVADQHLAETGELSSPRYRRWADRVAHLTAARAAGRRGWARQPGRGSWRLILIRPSQSQSSTLYRLP